MYARLIKIVAVVVVFVLLPVPVQAEKWSFGVMSDTQWQADLDGQNPDDCAVGIIKQINSQFVKAGVKFVIQVGDLVDKEKDADEVGAPNLMTRAAAAQELYDAGIGFYPLRGNHEGSQAAALQFQGLFPQAQGQGDHVYGAHDFSSPQTPGGLTGLSYAFDYLNARFVLLDQFTRTDNSAGSIADQQAWIEESLGAKPEAGHAFVFSHKQLVGGNHKDTLFGSVETHADQQDAFISSLARSNVRYLFTGHDHMHDRSLVKSPLSDNWVQQIICASDSYKFYTPQQAPNGPADRQIMVAQELYTIGYYIVTVDGPRVTVDFYSADPDRATPGGEDLDLRVTPALDFSRRETFGYSLNGRSFQVSEMASASDREKASFAVVVDTFEETTARILGGYNLSTDTDNAHRPLTKVVATGWTNAAADRLASNILTLWGMASLGSKTTDVFTLSLSYDPNRVGPTPLGKGGFGIAAVDASGNWVNAVDMNCGDTKHFVTGPWNSSYALGTYGVDTATKTAWAVINSSGDFAVARDIEPILGQIP